MERNHSHRNVRGQAPAAKDVSPTVAGSGSDECRQPFPVADIISRPIHFVRPMSARRIADVTNDPEMVEALRQRLDGPAQHVVLDRGERLAHLFSSWAIAIATTLMLVAILWTAADAYLDRAL